MHATVGQASRAGQVGPVWKPITFDRLCAALFFVAVAAAACVMPAQSDTWWHLRAGEEIWRTGTVPLRDSFSHTVAGGYWPDHEWLSQAVFYGVYRLGGIRLLTAVVAAIATATWALVWATTRGSAVRRLLLLALAITPASIAWSVRPQVLTLFMLALTMWLLDRRRERYLPIVFVIWANLHGAVLLGCVALAAATLAAAVQDRLRFRSLLTVDVGCFLATLMTPLGASFWTELPASLARIREYQISEWRAPDPTDLTLIPFWMLAAFLLAIAVWARAWRPERRDAAPAVWGALAILPLALTSARNIPPFLLLAVPAITALLDEIPWIDAVRPTRERLRLNATLLFATIGIAVLSVAHAWASEAPRLGWRPLPARAIAALDGCPDALYNRYDEGGFLIWFARRNVFLDGRQDPYPPSLVREQVRVESSGDYEATFRRFGIRCAFIPSDSLLHQRLAGAGWRPLYEDAQWAVLTSTSESR